MKLDDPNLYLVLRVANALGDLRKDLVFVGGCATGLLITDESRPPVRATRDVDLIAQVGSKGDYYLLARKLKELGFKEDQGDILCRWRLDDVVVDVMPTDERILGFSNRWYYEAISQAVDFKLDARTEIKLVTAPLLVATKIEAYYGRGNNDPGQSHDIEDIVNVVDGRPELSREVLSASRDIRDYLREEVEDLLSQAQFIDTLPWHFGAQEQGRVELVIERLRGIAGL